MKTRKLRNLIGPQVRRLRCGKNWSQKYLMLRLQEEGWNICRQHIARIESGESCVSDFELLFIAKVLNVGAIELLPKLDDSKQPLYRIISNMLAGQVKTVMSPDEIFISRGEQALALLHRK